MMWEEEKQEWCWGAPCQGCRDRKGGKAPDSVSGLRHSRVILLPGAEDSVWGKQETRGKGQEEGLLEELASCSQHEAVGGSHCVLCSLSCRKTLVLTGDSFTSRLLS